MVTLETGVTGEAVTRVVQLVRADNINVLVIPAQHAEGFVERCPCAVLTVPAALRAWVARSAAASGQAAAGASSTPSGGR